MYRINIFITSLFVSMLANSQVTQNSVSILASKEEVLQTVEIKISGRTIGELQYFKILAQGLSPDNPEFFGTKSEHVRFCKKSPKEECKNLWMRTNTALKSRDPSVRFMNTTNNRLSFYSYHESSKLVDFVALNCEMKGEAPECREGDFLSILSPDQLFEAKPDKDGNIPALEMPVAYNQGFRVIKIKDILVFEWCGSGEVYNSATYYLMRPNQMEKFSELNWGGDAGDSTHAKSWFEYDEKTGFLYFSSKQFSSEAETELNPEPTCFDYQVALLKIDKNKVVDLSVKDKSPLPKNCEEANKFMEVRPVHPR